MAFIWMDWRAHLARTRPSPPPPPPPPPLWIDWRAPTPGLRPVDTPGTARGTEPVRRGPPRRAAGVTVA